jgi:hypothetical protein
MAVKADLLTEVKNTLNITTSTFDTDLNSDLDFAVKDLFPMVVKEIAPVAATLDSEGRKCTVPATIDRVGKVELGGFDVDYTVHAGSVYLRETADPSASVNVYGYARFAITDYASIPLEAETAIVYWAVSKFYAALAGNKRKYNSYMGTQGAAADRDIKDSADFFKQMGDDHIEQRFAVRGY